MGSPTLQTLQDPILLPPWLCFRGGGFPNPSSNPSGPSVHLTELPPPPRHPSHIQVFNVPPKEQVYPAWLEGLWDVQCEFGGYAFPSALPKEKVISNVSIPGFQKLSLVQPHPAPPSPSTTRRSTPSRGRRE
jgi:hypothetical protein